MSVLNCFDIFTYPCHGSAEMVFVVANPVLQFYGLTSGKPRPGHIVLFQLPESHAHSGVELGLVLSIFKGIKAPKVFSGEASVNSIMVFRAVGLDMVDLREQLPIGFAVPPQLPGQFGWSHLWQSWTATKNAPWRPSKFQLCLSF